MVVLLAGTGPAAGAVESALGDVEEAVERAPVTDLDAGHALAVVVDRSGAEAFERASDRAREVGVPWIAVELGGVGGRPLVDAAVAGFDPEGACYRCLASRVASNAPDDADPAAAPADPTSRFAGAVAGRRAVAALTGEGDAVLGTVLEVPHAERELLPVPGCVCTADWDRRLRYDYVNRALEHSLSRAERALDDRVGLVAEVGEAASHPVPHYLARVCDTSAFADGTADRLSAGVDPDWNRALLAALEEGFGRYCAGVYRESAFETAAATDLANAVPPSAFVRPDDWGGSDAGDDAERGWVVGDDLTSGHRGMISSPDPDAVVEGSADAGGPNADGAASGESDDSVQSGDGSPVHGGMATTSPVRLPAELVHYPPPEQTIRPPDPTGLGVGNSTIEALLSGLYDVIARDAAAIAWYSTFEPLELVVEDPVYQRVAARVAAEGLDVTAVLLTQDVDVPVVGVAVGREEWRDLALGTAAHLDADRAARDALAAAIMQWNEDRSADAERGNGADGADTRGDDRLPAIRSFLEPDQRVPASSVGPRAVPSSHSQFFDVIERMEAAGLSAYASRLTTPDVAALGFEVVRVLAPTAQPLCAEEPYVGARARSVPRELGFEPAPDRSPHPFA